MMAVGALFPLQIDLFGTKEEAMRINLKKISLQLAFLPLNTIFAANFKTSYRFGDE